ncbi:MAG: type 2 isopentenyl-diphosphate Delta-isomerase, partial [Hyphomicrobium sp.]
MVSAPLLVSSMTGGTARSVVINDSISRACGELGLAFAVGSQRVALEAGGLDGFGPGLRRAAPNVPILANFGAAQLLSWNGVDMARRAVDMIEADALIIHLNPLQEAVQSGGDTNWTGLLKAIGHIATSVSFPIVVKEVGAGIS